MRLKVYKASNIQCITFWKNWQSGYKNVNITQFSKLCFTFTPGKIIQGQESALPHFVKHILKSASVVFPVVS